MKNNFNAQFLLSEDEINILLRHYKNALKSIHQYKADPYFSQIDAEKESVEFKKFTDICAMMINKIKNPQSPVAACANLKYGYRVVQVSVLEANSKENIMYDEYARISCRDAFTVGRDANNVLIQNVIERFVILRDEELYSLDFSGVEIVDFLSSMSRSSKISIHTDSEHPCVEFIVTDFYKSKPEYAHDREELQKFISELKKKEDDN